MGVLRTGRVVLRQWRDDDLPLYAAMNADLRVMRYMARRLDRMQSDAGAEGNRRHIAHHGWGWWAVEVPGVAPFIGAVGLAVPRFEAHFTPCVEIGWRLARDYWGFGYATEAASAAIAYGFDALGLPQIVSFTTQANRRSRAVMVRLGMHHDPQDDFDHPGLDPAHPLRRHVLYRLDRNAASG